MGVIGAVGTESHSRKVTLSRKGGRTNAEVATTPTGFFVGGSRPLKMAKVNAALQPAGKWEKLLLPLL